MSGLMLSSMDGKNQRRSGEKSPLKDPLKLLIWLYLILLLFEGALRKWVFPGMSDPLLIIRDPLVFPIYFLAYLRASKSIVNPYTITMTLAALAGMLAAIVLGHGNIIVAAFGARTLMLHFPMIFVIGYNLRRDDVILIGKFLLLLSIPMTLLLAAQFSSPQSAWVNLAPGGSYGGGLSGALGKFRPPGTFSFITGVVQYYTLTMAFLMSAFFERRYFSLWATIAIASSILVTIPISISRSLLLNLLIVVAAAFYGVRRAGGSMHLFGRLALISLIGFIIASQFDVFDDGIEAFTARWEISTSEQSGGFKSAIVGRFFGELTRPISQIFNTPAFGNGIGLGTQVGAKITTGTKGFLMGEGEWERIIYEMGGILGLTVILTRVMLCVRIGRLTHFVLARRNLLPWLLFSASVLLLFNGQWGQPTTLGFAVFGAGLSLAALRRTETPASPSRRKENETC
ncbi:MAG: hypothetical protein JW706_05570 [Opitutales bacterium]|nr:hypothetical protein [Opitutales bacterium]